MKTEFLLVEELRPADIKSHAVWQYVNVDALGETAVRPVKKLPVSDLNGKLVGTQVRLANGHLPWALLANIDAYNARLTEHFLTIAIERDGAWFHLARYHDLDFATNGPEALASFLGLRVDEVFPITYDLRHFVKDAPVFLYGRILKEPREKLTRAEIIALAVP
jgi:hypothetical protein